MTNSADTAHAHQPDTLPVVSSVSPTSPRLLDQPTVTVIGDGQLARMMHTEAIELGVHLRILASDAHNSASQVVGDVVIGDYTDLADLRAVVAGSDAVTFDHEHVPTEHLHALLAEGVNVQPGPLALVNAQDKLVMRTKLAELGAPVPEFATIDSLDDARSFFAAMNGAVCIKARRGGYDGNGVWFPDTVEELDELITTLLDAGTLLMAERKVVLVRELSAMVARTPSGVTQAWPVVESVQTNGICTLAIAPAPGLGAVEAQVRELAATIATNLGVTGALAVELFETRNAQGEPEIFVNELAMRPHNTGHWTQDGCITSQFEQHLRAVLDFPLGSTEMTAPVTVMANVLGAEEDPEMGMAERMRQVWLRHPEAKIHLYGKSHRSGRKIGHVNVSGEDVDQVRSTALACAHFLVHARWP